MRFVVEFGLELGAGAAGAGALRASGLRQEAVDDPMEHDAIIKTFAHQLLDPRHMARSQIRPHLDGHRTLGGFEDQSVFVVSHALFSMGLGKFRRSSNRNLRDRPATAPPMPSVNGIGAQRCNVSMTAVRYAMLSAWVPSGDSRGSLGLPSSSPLC